MTNTTQTEAALLSEITTYVTRPAGKGSDWDRADKAGTPRWTGLERAIYHCRLRGEGSRSELLKAARGLVRKGLIIRHDSDRKVIRLA